MAVKFHVKRVILCILFILFFLLLICLGPSLVYMYGEFIKHNHITDYGDVFAHGSHLQEDIPKVIHQIWFNTSIPRHFVTTRQLCQEINPEFQFILWNKSMVDNFVREKYPFIDDLFHSYGVWVQRADVARYLIIHHYGGLYIDMDTECLSR